MAVKLTSHPWLLGIGLGTLLFVGILLSALRLPWIWDVNNQWLMQLTFFSSCFFVLLISRYWRLRTKLKLWACLMALIAGNVVAVLVFIQYVRQLGLWRLDLILGFETIAAALFLDWFMDARRQGSS